MAMLLPPATAASFLDRPETLLGTWWDLPLRGEEQQLPLVVVTAVRASQVTLRLVRNTQAMFNETITLTPEQLMHPLCALRYLGLGNVLQTKYRTGAHFRPRANGNIPSYFMIADVFYNRGHAFVRTLSLSQVIQAEDALMYYGDESIVRTDLYDLLALSPVPVSQRAWDTAAQSFRAATIRTPEIGQTFDRLGRHGNLAQRYQTAQQMEATLGEMRRRGIQVDREAINRLADQLEGDAGHMVAATEQAQAEPLPAPTAWQRLTDAEET
jgi:hypothetical protein